MHGCCCCSRRPIPDELVSLPHPVATDEDSGGMTISDKVQILKKAVKIKEDDSDSPLREASTLEDSPLREASTLEIAIEQSLGGFQLKRTFTDAGTFSEVAIDLSRKGFNVRQLLLMCIKKDIDDIMTTADVVRDIVIPETERDQTCYMMSQFMLDHGGGQKAEKLVSHGWQSPFMTTVLNIVLDASQMSISGLAALICGDESKTLRKGEAGMEVSLWQGSSSLPWPFTSEHVQCLLDGLGKDILERTYWLCIFAVNEHRAICGACYDCGVSTSEELKALYCKCVDGKGAKVKKRNPCQCGMVKAMKGDPEYEADKFVEVVRLMSRGILVSLDPELQCLRRLWVAAEIAQGMQTAQIHFRSARGLSNENVDRLSNIIVKRRQSKREGSEFALDKDEVLVPPLRDCQFSNKDDKAMVIFQIQKTVKASAFDEFVLCMANLNFGVCWGLHQLSDTALRGFAQVRDLEMNCTWCNGIDSVSDLGMGAGYLKNLPNLIRLAISFEGLPCSSEDGVPGLEHLFSDCKQLSKLRCLEINLSRTRISRDGMVAKCIEGLTGLEALGASFEDCPNLKSGSNLFNVVVKAVDIHKLCRVALTYKNTDVDDFSKLENVAFQEKITHLRCVDPDGIVKTMSPEIATIVLELDIDWDKLHANNDKLISLRRALKRVIAKEAGYGVLPEHVQLAFPKDSGQVDVAITYLGAKTAKQLKSFLAESATLRSSISVECIKLDLGASDSKTIVKNMCFGIRFSKRMKRKKVSSRP